MSPSELSVAIWGATGSGKTVFLARLMDKWASLDEESWQLWPQRSDDYLNELREQLHFQASFPPPTEQKKERQVELAFANTRTQTRVTFRSVDRAGHDIVHMSAELQEQYIAASGLLLLLDPLSSDWQKQETQALNFLERLTKETLAPHPNPVAVCLAKADVLAGPGRLTGQDGGADFVRTHLRTNAPQLLVALRQYCATYRLFPVSAIGFRLHQGTEAWPGVVHDEFMGLRIAKSTRPFNMAAPVRWLLEQVDQ